MPLLLNHQVLWELAGRLPGWSLCGAPAKDVQDQRCARPVCLMAFPLLNRHFSPESSHSLPLTAGLFWRMCTGLMTHHLRGKDLLRTSWGANGGAQNRAQIATSQNQCTEGGKGCVHLTDLAQGGRSLSSGPQKTLQNRGVVLRGKSGGTPRHRPGTHFQGSCSWGSRLGVSLPNVNRRRHHSRQRFPKGESPPTSVPEEVLRGPRRLKV